MREYTSLKIRQLLEADTGWRRALNTWKEAPSPHNLVKAVVAMQRAKQAIDNDMWDEYQEITSVPPRWRRWRWGKVNADRPHYVSPEKSSGFGDIPGSESAYAARMKDKKVIRYALWADRTPADRVTRASVETTADGIFMGLPGEVLPEELRRQLGGFFKEKLPDVNNR
jgi:hypothetical protein